MWPHLSGKKKNQQTKVISNLLVISARVVCCGCETLSSSSSSKSPLIHESGELLDPARDDGYGAITFIICGRPLLFGKLRLFRYLELNIKKNSSCLLSDGLIQHRSREKNITQVYMICIVNEALIFKIKKLPKNDKNARVSSLNFLELQFEGLNIVNL